MLKRFMIGFVLGDGAMYWYMHHSEATFANANQWMRALGLPLPRRQDHHAVDDVTAASRTP